MSAALTPQTIAAALLVACLPAACQALELTLPGVVLEVESRSEAPASMVLPTGPMAGGVLPRRVVEGALDQRAYRLETQGANLTELTAPLRAQLEAAGFVILLDCEARACGGFDFRFSIDVMPEPGMHVDLGEYRFISAERPGEAVSLLISRSPSFGFVQVTRIGDAPLPAESEAEVVSDPKPDPQSDPQPEVPAGPPDQPPETEVPAVPDAAASVAPGDLPGELVARGRVVLGDLVFASGSAALEERDYASLKSLADWLKADPARSVLLVGHTDGSGALEANLALSKRRAEGVRQVLLTRLEVPARQVTAAGAGPLAPLASNQSEEGRRQNRRVEAVLTAPG